jgi:hypothetical protein
MPQNNVRPDSGRAIDEAQRWPVCTVAVSITKAKATASGVRTSRKRARRHRSRG